MADSPTESTAPTEPPTPERLEQARRRGQVAVSRDLTGALAFVALVAVGVAGAPAGWARALTLFQHTLRLSNAGAALGLAAAGDAALACALAILLPALAATTAAAALGGVLQTGGLIAWQAARPELSRLSPAAGLRKLFSARSLVELVRGLLKLALVGAVAVASVWSAWRALPGLVGASPVGLLRALAFLAARLGLHMAAALAAWGLVDWLLVRRRWWRAQMMTRDQVRRQLKEAEGDPQRKLERQRLHRELGEQRMIADVRKADFVVVNPAHIAVALRYDRHADAAPVVVAKGERLLAERIRQVAREAGVPIFRDLGLARALNELPEGHEIPDALYEVVAELLRTLVELDAGAPIGVAAPPVGAGGETSDGGAESVAKSPGATWKRV